MTEQKAALRKRIRTLEAGLTPEEKAESDRCLRERFLALPEVERAASILLFCGMEMEPETGPLLERLSRMGKRVYLPRCLPGHRMEAGAYRPDRLTRHRYGMLEPDETCPAVPPEDIALVLVPAVCYDLRGGRLGRGGGFYDRFLSQCPGIAVGMCREALLQQTLPLEAHDLPADIVVTERQVLRPGKMGEAHGPAH